MEKPENIQLKFITTTDQEYLKECNLRSEILRKPLGFPPGAEIFPFEKESLHLVALDGDQLVGCLIFRPEGKTGRIYQMAVAEKYQRQGIGTALLANMEAHLADRGFQDVYTHARHYALPFYEKQGYRVEGEPFEEIEIEHRKMRKVISTLSRQDSDRNP